MSCEKLQSHHFTALSLTVQIAHYFIHTICVVVNLLHCLQQIENKLALIGFEIGYVLRYLLLLSFEILLHQENVTQHSPLHPKRISTTISIFLHFFPHFFSQALPSHTHTTVSKSEFS